jgi:hypothetical protein
VWKSAEVTKEVELDAKGKPKKDLEPPRRYYKVELPEVTDGL